MQYRCLFMLPAVLAVAEPAAVRSNACTINRCMSRPLGWKLSSMWVKETVACVQEMRPPAHVQADTLVIFANMTAGCQCKIILQSQPDSAQGECRRGCSKCVQVQCMQYQLKLQEEMCSTRACCR